VGPGLPAEIALIPVGLLAGGIGGMLGIGGSVLMIPAMMLLLGPNLHLYQGAAMIVNLFVAVPSTWQHVRHRAVLRSVVRVTVPTAVAAVLIGVWISEGPWLRGRNEIHLARAFGVFLWYVAAYNAWRVLRPAAVPSHGEVPAGAGGWRAAALVGVPAGLVGGLLGVGGGIVAVPAQQVFLRMPLRNAVANSAATIVCLSLVGSVYKNIRLVQHGESFARVLILALFLIPTAILGAYWGARLTHRLRLGILRICLIVVLIYMGWTLVGRRPATAAPAQHLRGGGLGVACVQAGGPVMRQDSHGLRPIGIRRAGQPVGEGAVS